MGIWPSPQVVAQWVDKNWKVLIYGQLSSSFSGKGFFVFMFESKADQDLIFISDPYFMGSRGMYLNKWTLDVFPENDIPSTILSWVWLLYLPLYQRNDETIMSIKNTLGRYIDYARPRDGILARAQIYVEVDLEKGLP